MAAPTFFTFSSKWLALLAALLIMLVDGGGYNFGLYSEAVKSSLGYSQKMISTIALFRDIGANFGMHCGVLFTLLGPRAVLAVGACLNFVGYFVLWLIVTHKVDDPGIVVVSFLFFISANSQAFGFTSALITSVHNFPKKRGMVIGVVTSFVGMSGAVLAMVFEAIYQQQTHSYLLFNSWFTTGVFMFCLPLLQIVDSSEDFSNKSESRRFHGFSLLSFGIAGYLFVVILLKVLLRISNLVHCALTGVLIIGIVGVPFVILYITRQENLKKVTSFSNIKDVEVLDVPNKKNPERGDNFTVWQAVKSLDMWIIILASTCGIGSVLAAMDNLGQIGKAWGYSTRQITNSVSFNNIWNFLGRIGAGWISEILLQKYSTPRPLVFAATLVITTVGHLFIALRPTSAALMLASAFEGFALGALLTLIFTMTSELFGLKSFAKLYSMGTLVSTAVGTFLFSVLLAGSLFDRGSRQQHRSCYGITCYRESFLIMVGACLVGGVLSLGLAFRTKLFYRQLSENRQPSPSVEVEDPKVVHEPQPLEVLH